MSKSMISASTSTASAPTKPKQISKPRENPMTKSLDPKSAKTKLSSHCNVENGRQESADAKKAVPKAAPRPKVRPEPAKPKKPVQPVEHSDPEDLEQDEDIHPALLKQTRKSGSLNLSGRGLAVIPSKVWTFKVSNALFWRVF